MGKINKDIMDFAIYAVTNNILTLKNKTENATISSNKDDILQNKYETMLYDAIVEALGKNGDKHIWGRRQEG